MIQDIKPGASYMVSYPFIRATVELPADDWDTTETNTVGTWRPGVECGAGQYGDYTVAHGEGSMLLTVVDVHRPGKYPTRVFYTREWRDPDGKVFGRHNLRITTLQAFRSLMRGYRYQYEVIE